MTFTNRYGFPEAIAEALRRSDEDYDGQKVPGEFSVSELIGPPMVVQLRRRHQGEAEEDVSEQAYRLLGTALHYVIAKSSNAVARLFEKRLKARIAGLTVTGKPDLIDKDGWLNDYKVTSVWSFLLGDKPEWEAQLNMYDLLARVNNVPIDSGLRIIAILRDWKMSEKMKDPARYPDAPLRIKIIPRWSHEEQVQYLVGRIKVHEAAAKTENIEQIPVCTAEERWQDPERYAVYKGTNKRASKVCDTKSEAYDFIASQDPTQSYRVEVRESTPTRCLGYCEVAPFCPFGKQALAAAAAKNGEAE